MNVQRLAGPAVLAILLAGGTGAPAQTLDQMLKRQAELCAQSGGYLTAMGCQRTGGTPGVAGPPVAPPPMNCTKRETVTEMPDGSTQTKSTENCSSF